MFIFQFLFFIFIIFLIVGIFVVLRIYLTIRRTAGKFRDFANGGFKQKAARNDGPTYHKNTGYTIFDTRSEEVKKRKIFPDNVGEYVKYKEVR